MGRSEVKYRGQVHHAHDLDLALWMQHVVEAIGRVEDPPGWLAEVRDDWQIQATEGFNFGIMPQLDRHLADDGRRAIIVPIFRGALGALERHPETITVEELEARRPLGNDVVFTSDLPIQHAREVARKALEMIETA